MAEPLPQTWIPEGMDLTRPSAARMYDYYLGGAHNFAVDRTMARQVLERIPAITLMAQANRAFLHRAVRYLVSEGVRQFIDIGSGIPTVGNVHETAQREAPDTRVLYVDHDPVAVAHSELILQDNPATRVLQADLRRPQDILASAQLADVIDLSRPVAVLMVAVLHFISHDDRPEDVLRVLREAVAPGSYLVISHGYGERLDPGRSADAARIKDLYKSATDQLTYRSRPEIEALFEGWDLVEPGLVWVPEWRPDWPDDVGPNPASSGFVAGVGRSR